jgi:RimJ/RimL family protein N-acetyltransferase
MRPDDRFEQIVTWRLRLRRSVAADAGAISAYRSDPSVHAMQGWDRTDPEGVRIEIEEMLERRPGEPGGWVQFTVEDEATELVGDVGLSPADGEPGVIKVGYTIDPRFQGRGFATEAVAALVDYAFATLDAQVVRAYAGAENASSIRVMEKVGMRLIERFHGSDGEESWTAVRYEVTRAGRRET